MAPLEPEADNHINKADFVIFGGSRTTDHPGFMRGMWNRGFNTTALGHRWSHRITVSWSRATPDAPWHYSFSNWTTEDMGYPRVMPDATLLPNGDVVLTSGAQVCGHTFTANRCAFVCASSVSPLSIPCATTGGRCWLP
jgi:hypothetical protein